MRYLKSIMFYLAIAFAATSLVTLGCEKKEETEEKEKKEGEGEEGEAEEGEAAEGEAAEGEGEGETAEAEGEGEAAEGEGEAAEGEGEAAEGEGETADAGAWGDNCQAYFAEVEKICSEVGDDVPGAKDSCNAWIQSIEQTKTSMPEGTPPEAYAAAEEGCKAGLDAAKQTAAAWQQAQ